MAIGSGVTLNGYMFEDDIFTVVLAAGITASDIGKAVTQDTGAANKMKLAGDGDPIHGRLEQVENRVQEGDLVGTVAMSFMATLPIKAGLTAGDVVAVGSTVIGAGSGEVKNDATVNAGFPVVRVYEIIGTKAVCRARCV